MSTNDESNDESNEANSVESRVIDLLQNAIVSSNESEKVSFLNQAQEFVIHHDILDNFLDEILGFQSDRFAEVRKFVAGFIEVTCKKEPDYFPKVIMNLNMMLTDELPNVLKKAIQVLTQLYKVFLTWISKSKITGEVESTWEVWNQIKNFIYLLIDSTENDGVRTQCVKFIETVIICQTKHDNFTTETDFLLDDIVSTDNKLIDLETLDDEAKQLFEQLVNFQAKVHISSVNLMVTMQSLSLIARQRSKLFFNKVVHAFEALILNLPPTLAKSQVNSVNKQLKLIFLTLFKHPFVFFSKQQSKFSQILLNIGATQSEVNRCLQDVKKRGIKIESASSNETKRIKIEHDVEDTNNVSSAGVDSHKFNLDNFLYEMSKKISRHDAMKASDLTTKDLSQRLGNVNVVIDLILSSIHRLPDKMTDSFRASLNDSINSNQLDESAKQLSFQLTSSGIGSGIDEITDKYINIFENSYDIKADSDIRKKISSLVKKCTAKELKKYDIHHKFKLTQSGKTMTSAVKIKQLNLNDITKSLELNDKLVFIEKAVRRILNNKKSGHFSAKEFEIHHKILGRFLAEFSFSDSLKLLIKDYIFTDIRNRYDVLFSTIYFEYVSAKQNFSSFDCYSIYLHWIIEKIIDSCESKDRDYFLQKFYIESPFLTDNVINLLKKFIINNCFKTGINLAKLLIEKRLKHRTQIMNILLEVSIETCIPEIHSHVFDLIKSFYQNEKFNFKDDIEKFALKYLSIILNDKPEIGICDCKVDSSWNDEMIKQCLSLYLALLPMNHKLIHNLPPVYVSSNPNTKRVILRLLQHSIQLIGMNSPEILAFVKTCPTGAETLISRVVHIITEKQPPSTELVSSVRDLYHERVSDVRFLIPVLNGLSKNEIITILPQLLKLNPVVVKEVFNRLLLPHSDSSSGHNNPISPADLMIALHTIDPSKCDLKNVIKATNLCFEVKNIYTSEVLAVVMQMLLEQNPLPTLLMRTVIQALSHYPRLVSYVMNNILQRLILKQVWNQKKVWEGFIKCCQRTMPQSFPILLQLPVAQLKSVFVSCPEIRPALNSYLQNQNEQQIGLVPQALLDIILMPNDNALQPVGSTAQNESMEIF